jgi:hypothetical protein
LVKKYYPTGLIDLPNKEYILGGWRFFYPKPAGLDLVFLAAA